MPIKSSPGIDKLEKLGKFFEKDLPKKLKKDANNLAKIITLEISKEINEKAPPFLHEVIEVKKEKDGEYNITVIAPGALAVHEHGMQYDEWLKTCEIEEDSDTRYDYKKAYKAKALPKRWLDLSVEEQVEDISGGKNILPDSYVWPDEFEANKPLSEKEIAERKKPGRVTKKFVPRSVEEIQKKFLPKMVKKYEERAKCEFEKELERAKVKEIIIKVKN